MAASNWQTNLDEVIAFIRQASEEHPYEADGQTLKPGHTGWCWARNTKCKYVDLRFDMRDGAFIILDREGNRITLDDVKWQYRSEDEI